jgi:colicin import membrane protein
VNASSYAETPATESGVAARSAFDPPPPKGLSRALALALLAHLLLVLALAWGLRWKKDAQDQAVEAELWAATAQLAAPKAAPVPPPPPAPVTPPTPVPVPEPKPAPQIQDDSARQAEIALEQQKKREEQQRLADLREQKRRREAEERKRQDAAAAAKAAEQKARDDQAAEARREDNIRRSVAFASIDQAGAANPVNGQGKTPGGQAKRDAGPSAGYGAKVRARVYPNITYLNLNSIRGNPEAQVEVRTLPDGTIVDRRLVKSSGVPTWDAAVLRALDKTQILPRDVDGRVPSPITIIFTPH